jgi:hypothetical protein
MTSRPRTHLTTLLTALALAGACLPEGGQGSRSEPGADASNDDAGAGEDAPELDAGVRAADAGPDAARDVGGQDAGQAFDAWTLGADDYAWIVLANKGRIEQTDNMARFGNVNEDTSSPARWTQAESDVALSALLVHAHGASPGDLVEVTYAAYDGSATVTRTRAITLVDTDPFDRVVLESRPVTKANATRVYVHYMPWFASKPHDGYWGIHWTMANQDPDTVDGDGRRDIASHFYPLIGPYSTQDPDLVEYHLLLMKLTGIDGVLIDWYGTYDVDDYAALLRGSNALIDRTEAYGLDFGIVYEDRTTERVVARGRAPTAVAAATTDLEYIVANYFSRPNYIEMLAKELLLTFTPIHIETGAEWTQILNASGADPTFLAIWGQSGDLGAAGSGEFSWVSTRRADHLAGLESFFQNEIPRFSAALGSAYPGFDDFYFEGGWGDEVGGVIDHQGTATLALTTRYGRDAVQLVTWNDFGEGTMIEPTVEFGYGLLGVVQRFAGVSHTEADLELATRLYLARKARAGDAEAAERLDQVRDFVASGRLGRAEALLATLE